MRKWQGHSVVMGRTGSGKTHYVLNTLLPHFAKKKYPVLYYNGGHEPAASFGADCVLVDGADATRQIRHLLYTCRSIVYTPDISLTIARAELRYWQEQLMSRRYDVVLVVDEAQRYAPQGSIDTPLHQLATGGRRWGISCYFVCQRIADLSKTLATQAQEWIIFAHSQIDADYLRARGIDMSAEEALKLSAEKYSYLLKKA